jgi:hypothetical protein
MTESNIASLMWYEEAIKENNRFSFIGFDANIRFVFCSVLLFSGKNKNNNNNNINHRTSSDDENMKSAKEKQVLFCGFLLTTHEPLLLLEEKRTMMGFKRKGRTNTDFHIKI